MKTLSQKATQVYRRQQCKRLDQWAVALESVGQMYRWLAIGGITANRWQKMCDGDDPCITLRESEIVHLVAGWIGAEQAALGSIVEPRGSCT